MFDHVDFQGIQAPMPEPVPYSEGMLDTHGRQSFSNDLDRRDVEAPNNPESKVEILIRGELFDHEDLQAEFATLCTRTIREARLGIGTFLSVDLESEKNETLWIKHASWRVVLDGTLIGCSNDDDPRRMAAAAAMGGTTFVRTEVNKVLDLPLRIGAVCTEMGRHGGGKSAHHGDGGRRGEGLADQIAEAERQLRDLVANQGGRAAKKAIRDKIQRLRQEAGGEDHSRRGR
jgi:hypothetical protein